MTAAELAAILAEMPPEAEVLFEVESHLGPRDNGSSDVSCFHVYSATLDEDGDVILVTG